MKLFVGSLPFSLEENDLRNHFEKFGEVSSAKIILDKFTQRSRGFGFIEMNDASAAQQAINSLNGADFMGKNLVVNEARPKTDAPRSGGNRGGGGGFNRRSYNNEY